jgi:hypothetical protein
MRIFFGELPSLPWLTTGGYLKKKVNMLFNDFINQLITGGISALYVVKKHSVSDSMISMGTHIGI